MADQNDEKMTEAEKLCNEIARCENVMKYFNTMDEAGRKSNPCCDIIESQDKILNNFQIPEPWAGYIDKAPLLFLGSNPSIDEQNNEKYPIYGNIDNSLQFEKEDTSKVKLLNFYNKRLNDLNEETNQEKKKKKENQEKEKKKALAPYWNEAKKVAQYLYNDSKIVHGCYYALSEVVHCKSKKQIGVEKALNKCSENYLTGILQKSPAKVVVVFGDHAKNTLLYLLLNNNLNNQNKDEKQYYKNIILKSNTYLNLKIIEYKYISYNKKEKNTGNEVKEVIIKTEECHSLKERYFIFSNHPSSLKWFSDQRGNQLKLQNILYEFFECQKNNEQFLKEIKECLQYEKNKLQNSGGCNGTSKS